MSTETADTSINLMQVIIKMLYNCVINGTSYTTIIDVLSLVCLLSIVSRHAPETTPIVASPTTQNSIQKVLGDLTKGDSAGPESLLSLLPLLNSPQLKSKLNPTTITTLLGLMNSLGGSDKPEKTEKPEKTDKTSKVDKAEETPITTPTVTNNEPAAAITEAQENSNLYASLPFKNDTEKKYTGRALNWKGNFST